MYENFFCVIWKIEGVSLLKGTEEVEKTIEVGEVFLDFHTVNQYKDHEHY